LLLTQTKPHLLLVLSQARRATDYTAVAVPTPNCHSSSNAAGCTLRRTLKYDVESRLPSSFITGQVPSQKSNYLASSVRASGLVSCARLNVEMKREGSRLNRSLGKIFLSMQQILGNVIGVNCGRFWFSPRLRRIASTLVLVSGNLSRPLTRGLVRLAPEPHQPAG